MAHARDQFIELFEQCGDAHQFDEEFRAAFADPVTEYHRCNPYPVEHFLDIYQMRKSWAERNGDVFRWKVRHYESFLLKLKAAQSDIVFWSLKRPNAARLTFWAGTNGVFVGVFVDGKWPA